MLAEIDSDAAAWSYSVRKVFLNVSQIYKKTLVSESFFNEITGLWLKRDSNTDVFM